MLIILFRIIVVLGLCMAIDFLHAWWKARQREKNGEADMIRESENTLRTLRVQALSRVKGRQSASRAIPIEPVDDAEDLTPVWGLEAKNKPSTREVPAARRDSSYHVMLKKRSS